MSRQQKAGAIILGLLIAFTPLCQAGMQTAVIVVNRSEQPITVSFDGPGLEDNCIFKSFDPDDLTIYYRRWREILASDTNPYMTAFGDDDGNGVKDPAHRLKNFAGSEIIPTQDADPGNHWVTFIAEMKGSAECFGSNSRKEFTITGPGRKNQKYKLEDRPSSPWFLTQYLDDGSKQEIELGSGGYFNNVVLDKLDDIFTEIGDSFYKMGQRSPLMKLTADDRRKASRLRQKLKLEKGPRIEGFKYAYMDIPLSQRTACVMGRDMFGSYDCLVTGVGLIVLDENNTVAVPLPNIQRNW